MSAALLNKAQAAELLGVSIPTLSRWMYDGDIGYLKISRSVRFPMTSIVAFLERGRCGPITTEQICSALDGEIEEPARSADAT